MLTYADALESTAAITRRSMTPRRTAIRDDAEALLRDWAFVQAMTQRVKDDMLNERLGCSLAWE